ncbi:peptide-methionine (S)-S-oxide reductase MsrA [Terricaulis sp.]|uniref:peptide-methionine (S)-S-oxide reductase MsrA n=1 Tax=Terricaulis sp. TaxID=2768686 RepID=UPI002AC38DF1|nr:peptide-methionine (S)-S-oxide reductase MsrA [Terricaulis sp.]MDZ4690220.1 peptide-methionine (S)-S-oxide reductase MsrA [Terricaulis sp.]
MIRAIFASLLFLFACSPPETAAQSRPAAPPPAGVQEAVFAGGCFWCMEHDMGALPGVVEVMSGYTGGRNANPTYQNHPGHYEAVRVRFDPAVISYRQLVDRYWLYTDPTDNGGQFCDRGSSYRPAIFVTPAQRADAEASKREIIAGGRVNGRVITPILDLGRFTEAEEYHRDYARRNPERYAQYRAGCGRDARLREVWRR